MSNFENLVVLMVDGGLCSQLVKWAFGEFLKKRHGVKVKYDISWYSSNGLDCDGKSSRRFLLQSIFPKISFDIASSIEIEAAKNNYFLNPFPYEFCANLFVDRFPAYLDGYYENISYMNDVKDIIEKDIDFKSAAFSLDAANLSILSEIRRAAHSCAVHVRRGDFVNLGLAFLTPEYFVNAIAEIETLLGDKDVCFFFFSNDIDYVANHIIPKCRCDLRYKIVNVNSNDTGYLDLYLISQCNNIISSNSSFGFWATFLGKNGVKNAIFPSQWVLDNGRLGASASAAHYLPNAILLDEYGLRTNFAEIDSECVHAMEDQYNNGDNYLIETSSSNKKTGVCAIYFSSNGIFYPKDKDTFCRQIIQKNRFEWYKTRYRKASKHIFIRDITMRWYQYGISSRLNSIDKLAAFLKRETDGYETICIGSSSGGYAAILFACLIKAKYCFASSPCFDVKNSILLNRKHIRLSEYRSPRYVALIDNPGEYNDIIPLVRQSAVKSYCIYPCCSEIDIPEHAATCNMPNIRALNYISNVHGQPFSNAMIRHLLNLPSSLNDAIFNNRECANEYELLALTNPSFIQIVQFSYLYARQNYNRKKHLFIRKQFYKLFFDTFAKCMRAKAKHSTT